MRRRSNNGGAGGCARSSDKMVVSFSPPLSSFSLPVTGKEKEEKMGESEAGTVPCLTRYGKGPTVETPLYEQPVKICS